MPITAAKVALLPDEERDFAHYEAIIQRGLETFYDVGAALTAIKRDKLYRAKYPTFVEYCAVRWGIGESRAYQVVDAAKAVDALKTSTVVEVFPESERQVRPLTPLPPAQQVEAWNAAVDAAEGGQPTAAQVQTAAYRLRKPDVAPHVAPNAAPDVAPDASATDALEPSTFGAFRIGLLENGLRAIINGGLYEGAGATRCIAGCRVSYSRSSRGYVHAEECPLFLALLAL